jgi:hypothetical protein
VLRLPVRPRAAVAVLALLITAALLSACTKPLADLTVFSGTTAKKVTAQPKCVTRSACGLDTGKITELSAKGGSQILVDVPKKLADAGWVVTAFSTDSAGKNSPIAGAGSAQVRGDHSIRLNVPLSTGGYYLQVYPVKPSNVLTTWLVSVKITQ